MALNLASSNRFYRIKEPGTLNPKPYVGTRNYKAPVQNALEGRCSKDLGSIQA